MFGKKKETKKERPKKETKLSFDINRAIAAGKEVWRDHTTVMQALGDIPALIESDLQTLDDTIASFKADGGMIFYDETAQTFETAYKNVSIKLQFDHTGKKKFYTLEDRNVGKTPKNVIKTIGEVITAHHEISKRLFAKRAIEEIIAYLEDGAAKESVDRILEMFKDNADVLFSAINGYDKVFDIDIDAFVEAHA